MNEKLKNWEEIKLEKICSRITKGGTPTTYGYAFQKEGINFIKVENLNKGTVDLRSITDFISQEAHAFQKKSQLQEGDLLFSIAGTIGETCIIKKEILPANTNQALAIIQGFHTVLTPNFLNFQLDSFVARKVTSKARGGAMNNVSLGDLKNLDVLIPPLPEQRAIVAKIEQLFSELDTGMANLKAAKDKLEIYRQAVLKKAFEGELTKEWREQQTDLPTADELLEQIKEERLKHYKNQLREWEEAVAKWEEKGKQGKKLSKPTKIKSELELQQHESQKLINLPKKYWTYINIDFASSKLGDGLHGTPKYSDGEYYFINGNNLQVGKIVFKHDTKKVSKEEALKHYRELTDRTVLVSINGTLGNIAFYNNEKVMLGKSACYFNLLNPINKNFIRWLIESYEFRNYAFKTATGTTIKNVPLKAMRNFIFPLCSEKEQAQIVQEIESRLSVCDNILANIEEGLEKSEALRQSILKQAFEGKLLSEDELEGCRQEPDWEPAEKLLEEIKNKKLVTS